MKASLRSLSREQELSRVQQSAPSLWHPRAQVHCSREKLQCNKMLCYSALSRFASKIFFSFFLLFSLSASSSVARPSFGKLANSSNSFTRDDDEMDSRPAVATYVTFSISILQAQPQNLKSFFFFFFFF
jgi:hypothetical protein